MYYIKMRPDQIKQAVKRNVPVLIEAGAIEYHGPHNPIGTDYLIANAVVGRVEQLCECIVMPPLPFSPTMLWAGDPTDGEFDFHEDVLYTYAKELFTGLLKVGFRRIYVVQHHAGEEGMPSLTLKRAARSATDEMGRSMGVRWGWLDSEKMKEPQVFSAIQVAAIDHFSTYDATTKESQIPIGHAGRGETQLIMASFPDLVDMEQLKTLRHFPQWLEDVYAACAQDGEYWIDFCVHGWVKELK